MSRRGAEDSEISSKENSANSSNSLVLRFRAFAVESQTLYDLGLTHSELAEGSLALASTSSAIAFSNELRQPYDLLKASLYLETDYATRFAGCQSRVHHNIHR